MEAEDEKVIIQPEENATIYKHVLVSLREQSHALRYMHNTKTWSLMAVAYALHLNDCLELFADRKNHWKEELPFEEAHDVDFSKWKSEVWNAANDTSNEKVMDWKSLCDVDYKHFIELSNKFVQGELPLTPLLDFLKDKQIGLSQIILDMAGQLSGILAEIDRVFWESDKDIYWRFFEQHKKAYCERYNNDVYVIFRNGRDRVSYDSWKASKTARRLPQAIESEQSRLVKEISKENEGESSPWVNLWNDCYDAATKTIDNEGVARYLFHNRHEIIQQEYDVDDLMYTIIMVEFLGEKLKELSTPTQQAKETQQFSPNRESIVLTVDNNKRLQFVHKALIHGGFISKDTELTTFIDVFSGQGTDKQIKWVHKNDKSTLCYFVKQLYAIKDENGNIPWLTIRSRFVNKDGETFPDDIRSQHDPKKLAKTIDNIVELFNSEMNLEDFDDYISELFSDIRNVKDGNCRNNY
ncbi:MAG: hypothetical protein MJZ67_07800 [Bacteroidales bacterium]|nr:hypothetical protein [Bacteroidales bacterium]